MRLLLALLSGLLAWRAHSQILCDKAADVVFLMDVSGSIGDTNFQKQRAAVAAVASKFSLSANGIRMSWVQFAAATLTWADMVKIPLSTVHNTTSFVKAVNALKYTNMGGTATFFGIETAVQVLSQQGRSAVAGSPSGDLIVIFTDGESSDKTKTIAAADATRKKGITVMAVGVGSGVANAELKGIVGQDLNLLASVNSFDDLAATTFASKVAKVICDSPVKKPDLSAIVDVPVACAAGTANYLPVEYSATSSTKPVTLTATNTGTGVSNLRLCYTFRAAIPAWSNAATFNEDDVVCMLGTNTTASITAWPPSNVASAGLKLFATVIPVTGATGTACSARLHLNATTCKAQAGTLDSNGVIVRPGGASSIIGDPLANNTCLNCAEGSAYYNGMCVLDAGCASGLFTPEASDGYGGTCYGCLSAAPNAVTTADNSSSSLAPNSTAAVAQAVAAALQYSEPFVLTDAASWAPIALTKAGTQLCYISAADSSVNCPAFKCPDTLGTKPQSLLSPFVNVHGAALDACTIMAQRADGTVSGVGNDANKRVSDVGKSTVFALGGISPGSSCTMGILKSGKMFSTTTQGQEAVCTAQSGNNWAWISNQVNSACAGDTSGNVKCWGTKTSTAATAGGQPPNGTVYIAETNSATYCGLLGDGTPFCRGASASTITFPAGTILRHIVVDNGGGACGIKADYTLQCFGKAATTATYPKDVPFAYLTVSGTASGQGPEVYCGVRLMDARVSCFSSISTSTDVTRHHTNTAGINIKLPARMKAVASNYFTVSTATAQGIEPYSAVLSCPSGTTVSNITFASYGTPRAAADGGPPFAIEPACHAEYTLANVSTLCLGRQACSVPASSTFFGKDPCPSVPVAARRWLFIQAECAGAGAQKRVVPLAVADAVSKTALAASTATIYTWTEASGVAFYGGDVVPDAPLLRMPTLVACKQECIREPRCAAITYRNTDGGCFLKLPSGWKVVAASVISSAAQAISASLNERAADRFTYHTLLTFASQLKDHLTGQALASPSAAPGSDTKRARFTAAGASTFTVPSNVRVLRVSLWGAGGGTMQTPAYGGAGAFVSGELAVNPGEKLRVITGRGGVSRGSGNAKEEYGAGGDGFSQAVGSVTYVGSGGGGRSAIQRWDSNANAWVDVVSAGGGGGGCFSYTEWQPVGGAASWNGTGYRGGDGAKSTVGGTCSAGGAGGGYDRGGAVISAYSSRYVKAAIAGEGKKYAGGNTTTCSTCYHYSSAGGGGYYGGASGGCNGGGGGSSYITQLINARGDEAQPPRMWRAVGTNSEEWDAELSPGTSGRDGMVVINYAEPPSPSGTPTPTPSISVSSSLAPSSASTPTRSADPTPSTSSPVTPSASMPATATRTAAPSPAVVSTSDQVKYRCRAGTTVDRIDKAGALLISTPEAPGAVNLDCTWIVTAPVGYTVSVAYLAFNAEPNLDFLSIFDGNSASSPPLIYQATGGQLPPKVSSTGRSITVRFLSVDYRNSRGVILSPVFIPVEPIVQPLAAPGSYRCGPGTSVGVVQSSGAVIAIDPMLPTDLSGPRFDGLALVSREPRGVVIDCSVTIIAPPGELAVLTYLNYSLSPQIDFWSVHDGSNAAATPIVFLTTGGSTPPPVVVGSGSALHVRFQSVDYVPAAGRGVVAVVSFVTPPKVPISMVAAATTQPSPTPVPPPTPLPTPDPDASLVRITFTFSGSFNFDPSICLQSLACPAALQKAVSDAVASLQLEVRILGAGLQVDGPPPSLNGTGAVVAATPTPAVRRELSSSAAVAAPSTTSSGAVSSGARKLYSIADISAGLLSAAARAAASPPSPMWVVVEVSRDTTSSSSSSSLSGSSGLGLRRMLGASSSSSKADPSGILAGLSLSASNGQLTSSWAASMQSLLAEDAMGEGSDIYINAIADSLAKGNVRAGVAASAVTASSPSNNTPSDTGLSGGAIAAIAVGSAIAVGLIVGGVLLHRSRSKAIAQAAARRTKTLSSVRTISTPTMKNYSNPVINTSQLNGGGLRLATVKQASPVFAASRLTSYRSPHVSGASPRAAPFRVELVGSSQQSFRLPAGNGNGSPMGNPSPARAAMAQSTRTGIRPTPIQQGGGAGTGAGRRY